MSTGGAEPPPLGVPVEGVPEGTPAGTPVRPVHLPRRVRRQRTRGASLTATVADQVQWSVSRPGGRRRGGRGDNLRPRRRARHAGTAFGVRHRVVVAALTLGVLVCGAALVLLTSSVAPRAAGGVLLLVGVALLASVVWGHPFASLHAKSDHGRERRLRLRGMLEREAAGLELIADADPTVDPEWLGREAAERARVAGSLIAAALGTEMASEFSQTVASPPEPGLAGILADTRAKAFFVRYLVAYLDKYTVLPSWET